MMERRLAGENAEKLPKFWMAVSTFSDVPVPRAKNLISALRYDTGRTLVRFCLMPVGRSFC